MENAGSDDRGSDEDKDTERINFNRRRASRLGEIETIIPILTNGDILKHRLVYLQPVVLILRYLKYNITKNFIELYAPSLPYMDKKGQKEFFDRIYGKSEKDKIVEKKISNYLDVMDKKLADMKAAKKGANDA